MLWALPTWVMTNALSPFLPAGHPWRGRWFGLREWYNGRTPLTIVFDAAFWGIVFPMFVTACLMEVWRR